MRPVIAPQQSQALSSSFSRGPDALHWFLGLCLCALVAGCGGDLRSEGEEKTSLGTQAPESHVSSTAWGLTHEQMGVQTLASKNMDVGVIPDTKNCPANSELISIFMDDEDTQNNDSHWGWNGATESTNNTRFYVCRVAGDQFKPLGSAPEERRNYAVLKLGQECPPDSTEFWRYFDNEENANTNSWSAPLSSSIAPNISNTNTELHFCLFTTGASPMQGFPVLGISYGVFAAKTLYGGLQGMSGGVHTDDEDDNNANAYGGAAANYSIATKIVSDGPNTDINMVKVR